ncbi:hypothetical protein NEUTE1DRAFT_132914 [Neurospora tetrasperma FGSC 2508]|uniref:PEBP-like protein n=1 Tax=Neurospora tetrasperma (strain FGSC 2508 / ATCC MYA-4615 / P0657) TaxID=510951 RepID=F8N0V8_NEUT8|nr:uncharacterized protein NEUTE1DRAFT_132914 [Neurospora tetrasperma FGSC 2508]EGO52195.1 hypothetical protein NEUTE1DRAFT_132914 [Neurospora tetrasperma FGSC 2508]
MKWQTLVFNLLSSITLATPVYVEPSAPSPVYTLRISGYVKFHNSHLAPHTSHLIPRSPLEVSLDPNLIFTSTNTPPSTPSSGGPDLDAHYLSASGSVIGVFPDTDNNPIKFYAVPNKDTGLVELHNWAGIPSPGSPNTSKTKAIALVGNARTGLMDLTSVEDPAVICGDSNGLDCEWTSFTLNQGAPIEGRPANTVTYAGPGGWVAFKSSKAERGGWVVRWKYLADDEMKRAAQATTTQDFVPVDLVYEPIFTIADTAE